MGRRNRLGPASPVPQRVDLGRAHHIAENEEPVAPVRKLDEVLREPAAPAVVGPEGEPLLFAGREPGYGFPGYACGPAALGVARSYVRSATPWPDRCAAGILAHIPQRLGSEMALLVHWLGRLMPVTFGLTLLGPAAGCTAGPGLEAEAAELRRLHERVMEAHRAGDVESWMALEADESISANGGSITRPTAADRRAAREAYLGSTTFTVYRDLRPPIVRLSADATLGWLIAEVEVRGTRVADGVETPVDAIWAWIELYEKQSGAWRLIGNVSNRRPPGG